MSATLTQPVLPWSGAQEEDRRFRRILLSVLAVASVLSAILPQLQVPRIERDRAVHEAPAVVRMITRPISLFAPQPSPPQRAEKQAASKRPPAPAPPAVVVDKPQTPESKLRNDEPPVVGQTVQQKSQPAAQSARDKHGVVPTAPRPVDRITAARQKAAKTGLLAFSDSLGAARAFTPATPEASAGAGSALDDRPEMSDESSLLSVDVARGSGGIASGIPGPRELLGTPGVQDRAGGVGGSASIQGSPVGDSSAPIRRKTRSEEEIQEVLDRQKSAIYSIYDRELRKVPSLQGKVVLSITIAPAGKVTDCRIEYSELTSETLEEKLIRLIKGVDFGAKADVPSVTTRVPIEFFPI